MKLPQLKHGKWNYLALSFALPTLGMLVLMIVAGCVPFGKYSMLYSDMYHQYFPFFKAFREALLSGDSLLYNWSVGMGMDYLGLYSYYLASPLNLLTVLMPESWMLPFFSFLVPIKLGLAGLFFAIFLKKTFGRNDLSLPLFSAFYALCAWALGYQWNIMWLDTFALLPLVALGTVALLRDKKFFLYTVTLFLSIWSNYYIGLFTCIFVLLLFICYQICRCKSVGRFFLDLLRIAFFSALAIGMTAMLSLPTLAALQTTQSSVNNFPEGFKLNIANENTWKGLLDAMRQVAGNMNGGITPSFKEGLPNLYCGAGTVILAFLFLTSRHVKLRDKICSVLLLLFFMVSCIIRQLDYIWHGFHFTNMIPYRFTFLFSFVLLYMAYRAFLLRRRFQLWQYLIAGGLALLVMACSNDLEKPVFLAYNAVFFLLYMAIFLYARYDKPVPADADREARSKIIAARKERRTYTNVALAAAMLVEMVLNIVNFGVTFSYTYVANYPKGTDHTASMIRYMKEREEDNLFYRAEVTHTQTLNDGALNSYYGITTFTSSANVKVTEFMRDLGYSAKNTYNRYCFEEGSPVTNLFLNLKYMIERDGNVEENAYFDDIWHYGDVHLLENNAYLPLGFLAETELAELDFSKTSNNFAFQNKLFSAATGNPTNVWTITPGNWLAIQPNGVDITAQTEAGYCAYSTTNGGTLKYVYTVYDEGFLCLDLTMNARNSFTVWKNGVQLYSESLSLPQTIAVSDVKPGDTIELHATCKAGENSSMTIKAAILDERVFRSGYDILKASTLELTKFQNTYVEGTILCDRDGLLYTSIPQNGNNWKAYVDGKEADITLIGDAMIALELTEGEHTVSFRYENKAFSLGWKITLGCVVVLLAVAIPVYYPKLKPKKGKFEK